MTKYYTDVGLARCVKCMRLFEGNKYEDICEECSPGYFGCLSKFFRFFN